MLELPNGNGNWWADNWGRIKAIQPHAIILPSVLTCYLIILSPEQLHTSKIQQL
jgi:hypothetical protein